MSNDDKKTTTTTTTTTTRREVVDRLAQEELREKLARLDAKMKRADPLQLMGQNHLETRAFLARIEDEARQVMGIHPPPAKATEAAGPRKREILERLSKKKRP